MQLMLDSVVVWVSSLYDRNRAKTRNHDFTGEGVGIQVQHPLFQLLLQVANLSTDGSVRQAQLIRGAAHVTESAYRCKGSKRIER